MVVLPECIATPHVVSEEEEENAHLVDDYSLCAKNATHLHMLFGSSQGLQISTSLRGSEHIHVKLFHSHQKCSEAARLPGESRHSRG